MKKIVERCSALLILCALSAQLAAAETADEEIQFLIEAVGKSGCDFIRNGDRHDSEAAVEHLQLKYKRGKRYAKTAESFIDRLASKSSISGRPYSIVCADSGAHTASDWLYGALQAHRGENL